MRAFRLTAPQKTELTTTSQPEPGPGEVLVKVGAAGVCHSDLHIIEAPAEAGYPIPFTLGHENAGWVEAIGPGVTGWARGEPVAVYGISGCGQCRACLRGRENACQVNGIGGPGFTRDGGMAEYMSVPARQLVRIGDLDMAKAAPLTDAGLTPYHAIQLSRDLLRPGATCVVIGVGGLGHMAIQILAATTATRIIAVDVKDEALELAKRLGAHEAIKSDADAAAQIRALVGRAPGGAEVVIDCVCATPTADVGRIDRGGRWAVDAPGARWWLPETDAERRLGGRTDGDTSRDALLRNSRGTGGGDRARAGRRHLGTHRDVCPRERACRVRTAANRTTPRTGRGPARRLNRPVLIGPTTRLPTRLAATGLMPL
jgi:alcohol dehydrogenase, propanol-preferring